MADVGTLRATEEPEGEDPPSAGRRIRRQRSLPGGRAVVGALLISAAAVAVFAAYLDANAEPTTRYLVASDAIAPGTVIEDRAMALEMFSAAPIELVAPVDQRVLSVEELDGLVGRTVLSAMDRGDLLHRTAVLDAGGARDAQVLSFALPRADAVGGLLVPGERIDVLATYTVSGETYTAFVVRGVPLLSITGGTGGSGNSAELTVAVTALEDVQALGHAVNTASVFVTRSTADPTSSVEAPGSYLPSLDGPGPVPDPAGTLRPGPAESPGVADDEPGGAEVSGTEDVRGGAGRDDRETDGDQDGGDD